MISSTYEKEERRTASSKQKVLIIVKSILMLGIISTAISANAEEWIGLAQPGTPNSWGFIEYPELKHTSPNSNSASTYNEFAYYTETGVTGTHRDQFEFWVGSSVGYSSTGGAPNSRGLGIASPGLGIEYYFNVIVPDQPAGTPGYMTFWTSPTLTVNFPNGTSKTAGFGAGADQYSYGFSVANYVQFGKIAITINPIELNYASRNLNSTEVSSGGLQKLRGGLSITLMDVAAGYQVRDDLLVGIHHAYSIFGWKGSDFSQSREAVIGPAITYTGWVKYGLYVLGNVDFDYYTSSNLHHSTALSMAIIKSF